MMRVTVDTIVSQRDFGVIFSGTVAEGATTGERLRFKANARVLPGAVAPGETWMIEGRLRATPHGRQVDVERARRLMSPGLVERFIANHAPGIGPERARRLVEAFGDNLTSVLADDGRLEDIAAVLAPGSPVIGVRLAGAAMRCWQEAFGEAAVMAWLDAAGIDDLRLARRLYRLCGDRAPELLAANPYALAPLLSWKTLDALGRRIIGDHPRDRRRLVGAVDECVKVALSRGDTAITEDDLERALVGILGLSSPVVIGDAVAFAEQRGAVIRSGSLLRAPGAAAMEITLEERLGMLAASSGHYHPATVTQGIEKAASVLAPHPQQLEAARAVLERPLACLVGGAGTGKTYTCRLIVDAWEVLGGRVLPCALAGKAALRLSRSTGRLAKTLARTLAELEDRERLELEGASASKLEPLAEITADTLVLVDEASMVDLPTMHALVRRLPEGAHLLLVGDEAQLPPVGFGLVFHRLVQDAGITVRLTHVHRQAESTGIPAVAGSVRNTSLPILPRHGGGIADGVFHRDVDGDGLQDAVCRVATELGAFDGDCLIVSATNGGHAGVDALNKRLQQQRLERYPQDAMRGHLGNIFAEGDPVIFGRNDYRAGLVNGLMGKVTQVFPEATALEVAFEGEERRKLLESEQLLDLSLAYAVTCHKCQGSSARRIVVPLHRSRLMDPSWLYTAITRAERQVVLVGPLAIAEEALTRPWVADARLVGFRWSGAPK